MSHSGYYNELSSFDNVNQYVEQAELYRDQALASASEAAAEASDAITSEANAATSASAASASASAASTSATNATANADAAAISATAAATSATNAASSASTAASSESAATTSKNAAATSATNAATSASGAATSATNAASSASAAATSATNAASSASSASSSASSATTSKNNAATSETNAASSASAAATSATNAATSASSASSSASAASTSATNASNSATAAAASANSVDKQTSTSDTTAGRLMINGGHGLGGASLLYNGNLNTEMATGFYYVGISATNTPEAGVAGHLLHIKYSPVFAVQEFTLSGAQRGYVRINNNSVWTGWRETWDSANSPKQTSYTDSTGNRLMLTGAFGLGLSQLPQIGNMDEVGKPSGLYRYSNSIDSGTTPTGGAWNGVVLVQSFTSLITRQIAMAVTGAAADTPEIYVRHMNSVLVGTWRKLWTTADFSAIQASQTDNGASRVMLTGAFGLGIGLTATDMQTVAGQPTGFYHTVSGTTTFTPPSGLDVNGHLFNQVRTGAGANAQASQLWTHTTSGRVFFRSAYLNAWGPWREVGNNARAVSAWVNFNGTGTVSIRDSYNVSSITDNGVGSYNVNFTTPLANTNYSTVVTAETGYGFANRTSGASNTYFAPTVSSVRVAVASGTPSGIDAESINVIVTGGS